MIQILNRELTDHEFSRMKEGFDEHTLDNSVVIQEADRFTFVAEEKDIFVGTASGLAYKNGETYAGWFYLTDLFVEKAYRGKGWGGKLLGTLENELNQAGIPHIFAWTPGYEAPSFYENQGYHVFTSFENWYSDGSARVGFRKRLF